MAISGDAVPCTVVSIGNDGFAHTGYSLLAGSSIVEYDMDKAFQRIMAGESVHVHRYGFNIPRLIKRISDALSTATGATTLVNPDAKAS